MSANRTIPTTMHTRRHFLTSAPAFAALCAASTASFASDIPASDAELQRQMQGKLTAELNDQAVASTETGYLFDAFFSWTPPTVDAGLVNTIVAYSFGNRAATGGATPVPGPVNEQIADAVYLLHQTVAAPIYAQQEIASVLAAKYGLTSGVNSISTPAGASGVGVTVPTPEGVAAAIVKQAGTAAALGTIAVITHRDQASLAVQVSNAIGMKAAVPAGLSLPAAYDTSAQPPALRRRDLYLLGNLSARLGMLRLKLISQEYPNG